NTAAPRRHGAPSCISSTSPSATAPSRAARRRRPPCRRPHPRLPPRRARVAEGERPALRELVARGRAHYQNGEYPEASACFTEVLREKAPYADVYDMLGVIYHQEGRLAEAEQMLIEALRINPS